MNEVVVLEISRVGVLGLICGVFVLVSWIGILKIRLKRSEERYRLLRQELNKSQQTHQQNPRW